MSSRLHEILPQKPKGKKESGLNFKSPGTHTHTRQNHQRLCLTREAHISPPPAPRSRAGLAEALRKEEGAGAHPVRGDRRHSPPPLGSGQVTCGAWPSAAAVPTGVPRTVYGRLLPAPDERPGPMVESRPHKRLDPGPELWRSARHSSNAAAMVPSAAPAQWGSGRPNGQVWRAASSSACAVAKVVTPRGACAVRTFRSPARLAAKSPVSAGCAAQTLAARSLRVPEETSSGYPVFFFPLFYFSSSCCFQCLAREYRIWLLNRLSLGV